MSKKSFNDFRFGGLNYQKASNKYYEMDRVSEKEDKVVIKFDDSHLFKTQFGYGLIIIV